MSESLLNATEVALLFAVRRADEDAGGLWRHELTPDEAEVLDALVGRSLVEWIGEFGEAPDGEEDEREGGGAAGFYRITGAGVDALRDA